MATVKRGNVPPTHPTVWAGLALAVIGLLIATYAYTGARVYDVLFAIVAVLGALLALIGILVAAWGRSIMSARASRARRAAFQSDALNIARPVSAGEALAEEVAREEAPEKPAKKGFSFEMPKREKPKKKREPAKGGVFAFKRREPAPEPAPRALEPEPATWAARGPEPAPAPEGKVRLTLRCPECEAVFLAEGTRPFEATCTQCAFAATV